jgi:hypothetical protein
LLVDISGITGGFTAWESGATATYANGTIFMVAEGTVGSKMWAVGVNTLTHAVTHNISSTATAVVGAPGNAMVFSNANNNLYLTDGASPSLIYTLSLTSNTQINFFNTTINSLSGLAINDASTSLTGTFTVNNSSPTVTAGTSQTGIVSAGSQITFGTQPHVVYSVLSISGPGTTITLTANYTGTSSSPTTFASLNNDELATFTTTDFYLFHNLPSNLPSSSLVSNGASVSFSVLGPTSVPFGGLYKYFASPSLTSITLDPFGGENFTGGPAYWVTDSLNNVVYNLAANTQGGPFIVPLFNQLLQPGTSVTWQPGPFTAVNISSADSPYTTTTFDHYVIVDTTGSDVDVTLTTGVPGTTVVVMDGMNGGAEIDVSSSVHINGTTTIVIPPSVWGVKTFVFNGTSWNAY